MSPVQTSPGRCDWTALITQPGCVTGAGSQGRMCNSFPDYGGDLSPHAAAAAGPARRLINPLSDTPRPRSPLFTYHPKNYHHAL
ncbi:hypothetical protein PBY51_022905 [Eleginops maclovinus]|uniref:Uncharacterized protein n=1 Tax=Eleginops maclovinus TaxID=56733 RepID=A0AAN7XJK3_ELEMC|nr:hypothetical protein PBY51_022905 [Eleginops maclovinus]